MITIAIINKKVREHKSLLVQDIDSFLYRFRRQYRSFPLRDVNKLSKIKFDPSEKIEISGYSYTIKEAMRRLKVIYRKLKARTNKHYYTQYLDAFDKACRHASDDEIVSSYNMIKEELESEFKTARNDLWFCLSVLKALNALSKEQDKQKSSITQESEDVTMIDTFIKESAAAIVEYAHSHDISIEESAQYYMIELKKELPEADKVYIETAEMAAKENINNMVEERRLRAYTAYQEGTITLEEREALLDTLRDAKVLAESDACVAIENKNDITPRERYDAVRLYLYEKCDAGEITPERREDLIAEAWDKIMLANEEAPDPAPSNAPANPGTGGSNMGNTMNDMKAKADLKKQETELQNIEKDAADTMKDVVSDIK